jgi:hypothetical protein
VRRGEARGVQHRAIAADGDEEIGLAGEFLLGQALHAQGLESDAVRAVGEHAVPARLQVGGQDLHRLDDASVAIVADEGERFESLCACGHGHAL